MLCLPRHQQNSNFKISGHDLNTTICWAATQQSFNKLNSFLGLRTINHGLRLAFMKLQPKITWLNLFFLKD